MKKLLIFCLLFSITSFEIYSQRIIEYNFSGVHTFDKNENFIVRNGEMVLFKVKDVNPFLYKVTISSQEFDYNVTVPEFFKSYLINIKFPGANLYAENAVYDKFKENTDAFLAYSDLYMKILYIVHTDGISLDSIKILIHELTKGNETAMIQNIQERIDNINEYYIEFKESLTNDEKDQQEKNRKELVDEIYKKLTSSNFENLPYDFKKLINKINDNSFSFKSSQVKPKKDEIIFSLNIQPIDNDDTKKYGAGNRTEKFDIPVEVLGGFKIDFSTGLFITNLMDFKYITVKDSIISGSNTTRGYRVLRNGEGNIRLGFMALAHTYFRFSTSFNAGLNFGAGVLSDQNIEYMVGLSTMFGKTKRFILNGGFTFGYVQRLSSLVNENQFYLDIPLQNNITVKKLMGGWYLGISYNLTE